MSPVELQNGPIWLLQFMKHEGSGVFGYTWAYVADGRPGREAVRKLSLPDWGPHLDATTDQAITLQPQIYLDRFLAIGLPGPRRIWLVDLDDLETLYSANEVPEAELLESLVLDITGQKLVQRNQDEQFFIHDVQANIISLSGREVDGETVLYTPEDHYASSNEGSHFVYLRFPGVEGVSSFQLFASLLHRPGIIKARFENPNSTVPAPRLTPPPRLAISPAAAADIVTVRASAASGLARIRLYLDGRLVRDQSMEGNEGTADLKIEDDGGRWITALAIDKRGIASSPRSLLRTGTTAHSAQLYAVVVGIDDYPERRLKLRYTASDARRLASALRAEGYYRTPHNVVELIGGKATGDAIIGALQETALKAGPKDTIVFSFAGHGLQAEDGRYYVTPSNFLTDKATETGLSWQRIASALQATSARVVVVLDACHSALTGVEGLATNDPAAEALISGTRSPMLEGWLRFFEQNSCVVKWNSYRGPRLIIVLGSNSPPGPNAWSSCSAAISPMLFTPASACTPSTVSRSAASAAVVDGGFL
jgi:hypothetical protein